MKNIRTPQLLCLLLIMTLVTGCQTNPLVSEITETNSLSAPVNEETQDKPASSDQEDQKTESEGQTKSNQPPNTDTQEEPMIPLTIPELGIRPYAIPESEALTFVDNMGLGWNLGNTFDAANCDWLTDEMDYESAWNGTKTTYKMLQDIKSKGFQTIRIPVSWHNHVTGDDHLINEQWMQRVQEVVDWAVELDFFIILNMHHDTEKDFVYPDSDHYETSRKFATDIWLQVSNIFGEYDEKLIFELQNEPRLVGTDVEWWLDNNDPSCLDAVMNINHLNQELVNTVRSTGGLNAQRFLMVPGYVASPEGALHPDFQLPVDSTSNRLIVSVHSYSPYDFALRPDHEKESTDRFDLKQSASTSYIQSFMTNLYNRYILKGIPVIIGEFGSVDRHGNTQDRIDHSAYFVGQASARGMALVWWDNNTLTGDGERFCLYDRKTGIFPYPLIIEAMLQYETLD